MRDGLYKRKEREESWSTRFAYEEDKRQGDGNDIVGGRERGGTDGLRDVGMRDPPPLFWNITQQRRYRVGSARPFILRLS